MNFFYKIRYWLWWKLGLLKYSSPREKNRLLVFEETFEQNNLDDKWSVGECWGPYHPDFSHQYFVPPEGGKFFVKYQPKEFGEFTVPFAASHISTCNSFRQQYGRWECRCTVPKGKEVWPAFWIWGSTWPPEIDIFEEIEGRYNINLIYGVGRKERVCQGMKVESEIFHEFALEWLPERMDFFVDGLLVYRYKGNALKYYNLPTTKMWIVINHGIRSEQRPDYYSEMIVDYIRVYK